LFTPEGFFSPRYDEFCNDNEVMIRARCRDDLVKLTKVLKKYQIHFPINAHKPSTGYNDNDYKIVELPDADYLYRMKVDKNVWADYCYRAALDDRPTSISGGIKNEEKIDNRYLTYLSIWYSMTLLQDFFDAERKGNVEKMEKLDEFIESDFFDHFVKGE